MSSARTSFHSQKMSDTGAKMGSTWSVSRVLTKSCLVSCTKRPRLVFQMARSICPRSAVCVRCAWCSLMDRVLKPMV